MSGAWAARTWETLAQLSPDERVRAVRWAEGSPNTMTVVAVGLCAITLAALAYVGWRLMRHHMPGGLRREDEPEDLFETLAREHGLTRHEQHILRGIAGRLDLAEPGALFVRKSILDRELTSVPEPERTELEELMRKLFA